jgi:hypothetical protein
MESNRPCLSTTQLFELTALDFDYFATCVMAAIWAYSVWQMFLTAVRTNY